MQIQLHGHKELDRALRELPKAVGRAALQRALKRAGEPVRAAAEALAPRATGELAESMEIRATLKASQRRGRIKGGPVEMFIGSTDPKAHLLEFGTSKMPAQPFMRPAWDANKDRVLRTLKDEIWRSLATAARRLAKQAAGGKLSRASRRHFGG